MQKHISPAGTAPSTNIFQNPIMHIHSQHPYLLGFDSNLVPNSHILVFQPYPGKDSEYSEKSGRFAYSSASSLGNTPNNWENCLDWVFSRRIQQGLLQIPSTSSIRFILIRKTRIIGKIYILFLGFSPATEYIEYSPYSDRKTRIIGKFYTFLFNCSLQVSNTSNIRTNRQKELRNGKNCHTSTRIFRKIGKIARILHADREKLIYTSFVAIFLGCNYEDHHPYQEIQANFHAVVYN